MGKGNVGASIFGKPLPYHVASNPVSYDLETPAQGGFAISSCEEDPLGSNDNVPNKGSQVSISVSIGQLKFSTTGSRDQSMQLLDQFVSSARQTFAAKDAATQASKDVPF